MYIIVTFQKNGHRLNHVALKLSYIHSYYSRTEQVLDSFENKVTAASPQKHQRGSPLTVPIGYCGQFRGTVQGFASSQYPPELK